MTHSNSLLDESYSLVHLMRVGIVRQIEGVVNMSKSTKGTYEVQLLSAHDLEDVQVILRMHRPSERCKLQRRMLAKDYLGDGWI